MSNKKNKIETQKFSKAIIIVVAMMCTVYSVASAQLNIAVLDFRAQAGVTQSDVEGVSAIFSTYFIDPQKFTLVERLHLDRVIIEQGFHYSSLTNQQLVRIGQILNIQKMVVGDVSIVDGQYNLDVRLVNVELGSVEATEGATWVKGSSYRELMRSVATRLMAKIPAASAIPASTSVITLLGHLHVFPDDIGEYSSAPTNLIATINKNSQHGYNNWRLPTAEELALMRANSRRLRLSNGIYMTSDGTYSGNVRLVTTGKTITEQKAEIERLFSASEMVFVQGNVTINSFNIAKTQITQAQWEAVMGNNPSHFKIGDNFPVESVSWNDIQEFLVKLNSLTGKNYRLPTSAEWEYAARGGNRSKKYTYSGSNNINVAGWYKDNSGSATKPVGTKVQNELGIYDMSGNVWEWCGDGDASNRVLRGGSWSSFASDCRITVRISISPSFSDNNIGFRVVLP